MPQTQIIILYRLYEIIPIHFRQKTYNVDNVCALLSACLLVNFVDRDSAIKMAKCNKTDEKKYEWLDIFNRKKGQVKNQ